MSSGVENIIELLGPREVIGQAIELLMTRDQVSRDAAFELLVQGSAGAHRKVREIAAEIVEQRVVEQRVVEQRVVEQRVVEQRVAE